MKIPQSQALLSPICRPGKSFMAEVAVRAYLCPTLASPPWLLASTLLPLLQIICHSCQSITHSVHTVASCCLTLSGCSVQSDGHQLFKIHFPEHIFTNVEDSLRMYHHNSVFPPLGNKQSVAMQKQAVPSLIDFIIYIYLANRTVKLEKKTSIQSDVSLHRKIIHQSLLARIELLQAEDLTDLHHPFRYARSICEIYLHLTLAPCPLYFVPNLNEPPSFHSQ